jgi:hypothetical protein
MKLKNKYLLERLIILDKKIKKSKQDRNEIEINF